MQATENNLPKSPGSKLGEALEGALAVRYDSKRGYILAWFGGRQMHAYLPSGLEFTVWNVDSAAVENFDAEAAMAAMGQRIEDGEYRDDR